MLRFRLLNECYQSERLIKPEMYIMCVLRCCFHNIYKGAFRYREKVIFVAMNLRSNFILTVEDFRHSFLFLSRRAGNWFHMKWGPLWWKSLVHIIPERFFLWLYDSRAYQVSNPVDNVKTHNSLSLTVQENALQRMALQLLILKLFLHKLFML